jgi:hypothetical protein
MYRENRSRLPARMPGYEDNEVGRILPVYSIGVNEPAIHFVELEGGAAPSGFLPAGPRRMEELLHMVADVPSCLVLGRVDDCYPKVFPVHRW